MGDHGRFIRIDEHSYLQVFVGVQNYETVKETIDEEVRFILSSHKKKEERAEVVSRSRSRLGGVSATRLRVRYQDAKTADIMLEDHMICLPVDRVHSGFIYSVTLSTAEKEYVKRNALFYSIIKSWRFRSVP